MLQKLVIAILFAGLLFFGFSFEKPEISDINLDNIEQELIRLGVIDENKWSQGYKSDLNILWAFGLANKNEILEQGPMQDYGKVSAFASTGGWSLAKGDAMDHYSKHKLLELSESQQKLVVDISQNIYRPCCGNPTYFPDCNHGMAMLGLLEILASQGKSEAQIYETALEYNSKWFPGTYATINKYFPKLTAQEKLSYDYSSSAGYRRVLSRVDPVGSGLGSGCGI